MKRQLIAGTAELAHLEQLLALSAETTRQALSRLIQERTALEVLASLKFGRAGRDPLDDSRELNLVEQLNQTFTYLASFRAARWLLKQHPKHAPFALNLGTSPGTDIESTDHEVAAETFAATHPQSNQKLQKDIEKVGRSRARYKYVFYLSPAFAPDSAVDEVRIIRLEHPLLSDLP